MVSKFWLLATLSISIALQSLCAQDKDPLLFRVNKEEVRLSEFSYIYGKTNGDKADYSKESLEEYLQLYIDFKLQLQKGKEDGLDKDPAVRREQEQYRQSLAETYLSEREITEKLVKEAYERSKEDRRIAHILISLPANADSKLEEATRTRVETIAQTLNADNFEALAKQYSNDSYSKDKGGDLGYFSVLQLPSYALENAVYTTAKGQVSAPVRSQYGYHFVMVTDVRPAFGKVQTAHIFLRPGANSKERIDSMHNVLKTDPQQFANLAALHSQDNVSKRNDGLIGWVTINQYESTFQDAVFALERDGQISAPLKTSSGWHILRRIKTFKDPSFAQVKSELTAAIKRDSRYALVEDALVQDIQKNNKFQFNRDIFESIVKTLEKENTFLAYSWKPTPDMLKDERILFQLGDNYKVYAKEFYLESQRATQERFIDQPKSIGEAADKVLKRKLIAPRCIEFETAQLGEKYPDFQNLLREYQEGILLFEVKKKFVWDKASADEEGLAKFYEANKNKYQWKERANVSHYIIRSTDPKLVKKIYKGARKKSPEQMTEIYNADKPMLQVTTQKYERGTAPAIDAAFPDKWKRRLRNDLLEKDGTNSFYKIEEVIAPEVKALSEARGMVVADYQEQLEKEFIQSLRKAYTVEVQEDVLKQLIKS